MITTLRFSKELYTREAIDEVVEAWAEVGTFSVGEEGEHHTVAIESLADEALESDALAEIAGEFGNYLLGVVVNNRR